MAARRAIRKGDQATRGATGIKAVAEAARVSVGTVSNVLNHPDRVRPDTAERVRQAIAEVGYVRNESARQLRAGRGRVLGLVVLDATNPFFADVATGVEEIADQHGSVVAVANSGDRRSREERHLETMLEQRVQGLLITPVDGDLPILDRFAEFGIPVVFVDRHAEDRDLCSVSVNDVLGGRLAGRHLVEGGRRRIAFVGGPLDIPQVRHRLQGLREVADAADDPVEVVVVDPKSLTLEAGAVAMAEAIERQAFDAVFAANDLLALGTLQTLISGRIRVPDEVALVGYDDIDFAGGAAIPLTSVRQPRAELGRTAAQLLFEELARPGAHVHQSIEYAPELVVRESSGAHRDGTNPA